MSASHLQFLQPEGWAAPRGYANGVAAEGRMVFVAGQVGWNAQRQFETDDFAGQVEQALINMVAVLRSAGAGPEHLVRMTWYVTDKAAYVARQKELGQIYRNVVGRHFPAMTLLVVAALLEDRALVEIEATAVLPA
jgi:enamine deaminase RidA (YjgF/YER057c/UK114 family)